MTSVCLVLYSISNMAAVFLMASFVLYGIHNIVIGLLCALFVLYGIHNIVGIILYIQHIAYRLIDCWDCCLTPTKQYNS